MKFNIPCEWLDIQYKNKPLIMRSLIILFVNITFIKSSSNEENQYDGEAIKSDRPIITASNDLQKTNTKLLYCQSEYPFETDIELFQNEDIELSQNNGLLISTFKNNLDKTFIIGISNILDMIYAIYPICLDTIKIQFENVLYHIQSSSQSKEKNSKNNLNRDIFKSLNMFILVGDLSYNIPYSDILGEHFNVKFESIKEDTTEQQIIKIRNKPIKIFDVNVEKFLTYDNTLVPIINIILMTKFEFEWKLPFNEKSDGGNTEKFYPIRNNYKDYDELEFMNIHYTKESVDFYNFLDDKYEYYEKIIVSKKGNSSVFFIMPMSPVVLEELIRDITTPTTEVFSQISNKSRNYKNKGGEESIKIYLPKFNIKRGNNIKDLFVGSDGKSILGGGDILKNFLVHNIPIKNFRQEINFEIHERGSSGENPIDISSSVNKTHVMSLISFNKPFLFGIKVDGVIQMIGSYYGND